MTTSTPTAPLDHPGGAPAEDDRAREVLVGVDGSECGLSAVRGAAREAARRNAPLRILHAAPYLRHHSPGDAPPPELARARRITAQAYTMARHTDASVEASAEVAPGDPTTELLQAAAAGQLVVLGACTTGAADGLVLASVAVRVAARSPHPVVVVPRRRPGEDEGRRTVAVLGVGGRDDDEAVATFAAESAERSGVELSVLQTRPPRRSVGASWVDDPEEWRRRYPALDVSLSELPAARADRVLGAACPATLMVISAGTGTLLHRDLDGPHRWLLRHGTSPMALVPAMHRREKEPREGIIAHA